MDTKHYFRCMYCGNKKANRKRTKSVPYHKRHVINVCKRCFEGQRLILSMR